MAYGNRSGTIRNAERFIAGSLAAIACVVVMRPSTVAIAAAPTGLDGKPSTYEAIVRSLRTTEFQTVEGTNQPARLTLRELAAGQKAWREAIRSMRVEMNYRYQRQFETTGDLAAMKAGKSVKSDLRGEVLFAMKGDKRLVESSDTSPGHLDRARTEKERAILDAAYVDKPHFWNAFDGEACRRYDASNRAGMIDPRKLPSLENEAVAYFEAIFVPVIDSMLPAGQTEWNVEVALNSSKLFRLLPTLEKVDGHLCHVVTSGWDTIWIDADQGFAVLRRVHFRRLNANDLGELSYVQVCRGFVNAGRNVWLPTKTVQLVYTTYDQPPKDRGKLHWVKQVDAQPYVGDLPDSLFHGAFPPGTRVHDYVSQTEYLIPRGEDSLDKAIVQAQPLLAIRADAVLQQPAQGSRPSILLWVVGAVPLVAVVLVAARGRRARTALLGTVASGLCLLAVAGLGSQSTTFGKTVNDADASEIWGGDCTPAWAGVLNGACNTFGQNVCILNINCANTCGVNCAPLTDWVAGGTRFGTVADRGCKPYMQPTCDTAGQGTCACGAPMNPFPCAPDQFIFGTCIGGGGC